MAVAVRSCLQVGEIAVAVRRLGETHVARVARAAGGRFPRRGQGSGARIAAAGASLCACPCVALTQGWPLCASVPAPHLSC